MNGKKMKLMSILMLLVCVGVAQARIKLVALPERAATVIRLDNPNATLIEEERALTLQKGINKVDFSWNGVSIDADSIRLKVLGHPGKVKLLNVSYPPGEAAFALTGTLRGLSCKPVLRENFHKLPSLRGAGL